jgi:membrane-bound ClpP family serine protease
MQTIDKLVILGYILNIAKVLTLGKLYLFIEIQKNEEDSMGIAGLILGILGLIGAWLPVVVYGAWLLALAGIIISAIAMKKAKSGIVIAGLIISIIGFVVALPKLICAIACASAVKGIGSGMGAW